MEAFKLAFETTIVGLLTFVWLGLATYVLFPKFLTGSLEWISGKHLSSRRTGNNAIAGKKSALDLLKSLDVDKYKTTLGVGILTLAYCLGSAIVPIAKQLVDDEHWPLNEDGIRCRVFIKQRSELKNAGVSPRDQDPTPSPPRYCSHWAPIFVKESIGIGERMKRFRRLAAPLPGDGEDKEEKKDRKLREILLTDFQQQEAEIQLQPPEKTELLRQLHERIVVLRGAVFSGFVFLLICLSAYFTRKNGGTSHWTHWIRPGCGIMLAAIFTTFALLNGIDDLKNGIFDIPVLESLLLVITIFGVVVAAKGANTPPLRKKRYGLVALFFTGLTYGGWTWSEILYDQQVMSWFAVLHK